MNPKDKHEASMLAKAINQNSNQLISLLENGDMVKQYYGIDLETNQVFVEDIDFKRIEQFCQKSNRSKIAIVMLKSVLEK